MTKYTNIKLLRLRAHLQELPDRVDESLVVVIAHPLDVLIVSLDTIIQLLHELLVLVAIVDRSAIQTIRESNQSHRSQERLDHMASYICTTINT